MRFNQFTARSGLTRRPLAVILTDRCSPPSISAFSRRPVWGAGTLFPCVSRSRVTNHESRITLYRVTTMANLTLFEKLEQIESRYDEMTRELSSPEVHDDSARYQKLAKQHSELGEIVAKYREWKEIEKALEGAKQLFAEADDAEMKQMAHDEQTDAGSSPRNRRARSESPADPEGSQRRKKRDPRNSRRHRRRRGLALCRRAFPHVLALRGIAELESRDPGKLRLAGRRHEGNRRGHSGQQSLFQAEIRKRRAPRPARSRDRAAGPHPHVRRDRRRASRSGRHRHQDRSRRTCASTRSAPPAPAANP